MQELIKYILSNIVSDTDALKIEEQEQSKAEVFFKIFVSDEDKGIVIGKGGRNIQSLRSLVNIVAKKQGKKAFIKIED